MKHSLNNFDIYPLVFPADREALIHVRPLFGQSLFPTGAQLKVLYNSMIHPRSGMRDIPPHSQSEAVSYTLEDDVLIIRRDLPEEQEHTFTVYVIEEDGSETLWLQFNVYSLKEDLMVLRPFKGDFHMHSTYSDGKQSPDYVTASCRKIGLDFMVLTDHHKYRPSLEAVRFAEILPTSLKVFPGEEVHLPDNPVHIVNFGGSFSVNELALNDEATYRDEIGKRADDFPAEMPDHIRFQIASSEWAYDKIREGGGLAMYCHPYWRPAARYNYIWDSSVDWMFRRSRFDIYELLGGYHRHESFSNNEQTSFYTEELVRRGGKVDWAVAGVSDSHDCDGELFGWFYTILFADDCRFDSLKKAFGEQRSVAVKSIENECPEIYGDLRYVRYTGFLMKNFFPRHDSLCRLEGELMLRHLSGEEGMADLMESFPGRSADLYDKYWSRSN